MLINSLIDEYVFGLLYKDGHDLYGDIKIARLTTFMICSTTSINFYSVIIINACNRNTCVMQKLMMKLLTNTEKNTFQSLCIT